MRRRWAPRPRSLTLTEAGGARGTDTTAGAGSIPRERISIQLYTLRELPLEEQLKGFAQIGYKTSSTPASAR